jgi:ssDNA-binding Zn-finger/Zn-ribbon topoisomerase 1
MTMIFKSDCPQCRGKNKLRTKIDMGAGTFSKAKCYKCGWYSRPGWLATGPRRAALRLPAP